MKNELSITVVILTFNEAIHIRRCIENAAKIAERIIVVDSYSTDNTLEILSSLGAEVFQNRFVNQAQQFQWALDNINISSDWILKLDADEFLFPETIIEIKEKLPGLSPDITGIGFNRRVFFMDRWIKKGYYPMVLLRMWRNEKGFVEQKWMDEHVKLKEGQMVIFKNDMADYNLNTLSWWTEKHNNYATREAIVRLGVFRGSAQTKSAKMIYYRLPLFVRPFLYFFYRYIFRGGFLEGRPGLIWHILQGFWFQFLVDAKIYQIKHRARKTGRSVKSVLVEDFGVKHIDGL